jgi:opine dehydrogenase
MCILSTSWIEKSEGRFRLHLQALTPSVERVRVAMRRERDAIFKLMGWSAHRLTHMGASGSKVPSPITLHIGPTSLDKHRFIAEDGQIGDTFLTSLGDMIGVPTPTTKALVHMASIINQTDYFKTGRTVEKVGLAGFTVNEVNRFLKEGYG